MNNETADQNIQSVSDSEIQTMMEKMRKLQEEEKQLLDSIEIVHAYNEKTNCGFGWQESEGKPSALVEFKTEVDGFLGTVKIRIEEITLADSLEWIEHMQFAEVLLDITMQSGPGYVRWIQALRTEVL
jgi:hypothetical protein